MKRLTLLAVTAALLTGCATGGTATLSQAGSATLVRPHLAGHESDRPHADHVLVAGDSIDLALPTATLRVKVNGPALVPSSPLVGGRRTGLASYLATFTVHATVLRGELPLAATDFDLLAIADQALGGAVRTHEATASTLAPRTLTAGQSVVGTWTAPFVEGHGEFLLTPRGAARPAVLWDFRVES